MTIAYEVTLVPQGDCFLGDNILRIGHAAGFAGIHFGD